ncbi:hypothetical protein H7S74_13305 [Priestia aryabhattai]|uniref:hypothetical protein n=1 Tax=Priestia aryabhattai TaxID=412384 RepID=UPI001EBE4214|nr:hypothetical protein [Priestia aryabhattai]MBY0091417.1 hypothetical protein [Priestia aryabhattai]MBY0102328.1 hypothetical protein [Priestia aryabhattai]
MNFTDFELILELNKMEQYSREEYKFTILKKAIINNKEQISVHNTTLILSKINNLFEILVDSLEEFSDRDFKFVTDEMFDHYFSQFKKYKLKVGNIPELFDKEYKEDFQKKVLLHWENEDKNSEKPFIKVFDDFHRNCVEKHPKLFIKELGQLRNLYRAQRGRWFNNYERMVPIPARNDNRWNPKGYDFLYLGYENNIKMYDKNVNSIEKTCFEELRLQSGEDVTTCKFSPVNKKLKIIDFCYEDISFYDIENNIEQFMNEITQEKTKEILKDQKNISKIKRSELSFPIIEKILSKDKKWKKVQSRIRTESEIYLGRTLMKNIDEAVFLPIDEKKDPELNAYKPFHLLSKYLMDKGYGGILFRSTRMNLIDQKGKNLVLFNKEDATYVEGSIKVYHYDGQQYHPIQHSLK